MHTRLVSGQSVAANTTAAPTVVDVGPLKTLTVVVRAEFTAAPAVGDMDFYNAVLSPTGDALPGGSLPSMRSTKYVSGNSVHLIYQLDVRGLVRLDFRARNISATQAATFIADLHGE